MYNHTDKTRFTNADCVDAVGKRATLALTGTIVEARESAAGSFVMFAIDERWGLGDFHTGVDLDALSNLTSGNHYA